MTKELSIDLKIRGETPEAIEDYLDELGTLFRFVKTSKIIQHREDSRCHVFISVIGSKGGEK